MGLMPPLGLSGATPLQALNQALASSPMSGLITNMSQLWEREAKPPRFEVN